MPKYQEPIRIDFSSDHKTYYIGEVAQGQVRPKPFFPHGQGTMHYPDGTTKNGLWKNGKLIEENEIDILAEYRISTDRGENKTAGKRTREENHNHTNNEERPEKRRHTSTPESFLSGDSYTDDLYRRSPAQMIVTGFDVPINASPLKSSSSKQQKE